MCGLSASPSTDARYSTCRAELFACGDESPRQYQRGRAAACAQRDANVESLAQRLEKENRRSVPDEARLKLDASDSKCEVLERALAAQRETAADLERACRGVRAERDAAVAETVEARAHAARAATSCGAAARAADARDEASTAARDAAHSEVAELEARLAVAQGAAEEVVEARAEEERMQRQIACMLREAAELRAQHARQACELERARGCGLEDEPLAAVRAMRASARPVPRGERTLRAALEASRVELDAQRDELAKRNRAVAVHRANAEIGRRECDEAHRRCECAESRVRTREALASLSASFAFEF